MSLLRQPKIGIANIQQRGDPRSVNSQITKFNGAFTPLFPLDSRRMASMNNTTQRVHMGGKR